MRVFVAGASGAVGRRLVPLLVAAGHDVTGTSRSDAGLAAVAAAGATPVRLDVFDADAVGRAVADARPDAVVHQLTALSDVDLAANARIRVEGTRNLVDAAKRAGVGRIVAQSIAWAYAPGSGPAVESEPLDRDAPQPRAGTVAGVVALEDAVAELPAAVVLRYGLLYGPGTWYAPGARAADQVAAGEVPADDAVASFVHVEDAARAAVAALGWPAGAVNVVDDEPAAGRAWVPAFAAACGVPAPGPAAGGAAWARGASNAYARAELGWTPAYATWRTGFGASDPS